MTATDKAGINADRANTVEQVDHAPDRWTQVKPAGYVAYLLSVGRSTLYWALVA
jgi:hypothetical protein